MGPALSVTPRGAELRGVVVVVACWCGGGEACSTESLEVSPQVLDRREKHDIRIEIEHVPAVAMRTPQNVHSRRDGRRPIVRQHAVVIAGREEPISMQG